MFKHLSMLLDHSELPSLVNRYDRLRINGELAEAALLRKNIAYILKNERKLSALNMAS